jgi:xanthine dehydrogenase accessory factor
MYAVDDRVEFANKERFPEAETRVISDYSRGLENVSVNSNTYIVVATRGHRYDDLALAAAIRTPARYIGLLGSRRKTLEIYKNLLKEKVPPERLREVYAPIGLNIGAITPEELAVSIMAEIIVVRNGGDGMSMKMNTANLNTLMKHEDPDQAL